MKTTICTISVMLAMLSAGSTRGDVAVVGNDSNNILIYSDSGEYVGVFAEMTNPVGIAVGPDGDVFVSHQGITRYAPDGTELAHFNDNTAFGELAFGPDGSLYTASFFSDQIGRYDVSNGSINGLGSFVASGLGGLDGPTGLTFGPDENLYVTSRISGEILRYDGTSGDFIDSFAISGGNNAQSLTFGPDDNLYVFNGGIRRYDGQTGDFLDVFAKPDVISEGNIAFGPDGHLYASGRNFFPTLPSRRNQIDRFDGTTGEFLDKFIQNPRTESGTVDDFPLKWPTQFVWGDFSVATPPAPERLMIGINDNRLVLFDPFRGLTNEVLAVLPDALNDSPGFELDANNNRLLVMDRSDVLYSIDAATLDVERIGQAAVREAEVPTATFGTLRGEAGNLALDPATDTLYTTVTYSDFFKDNKPEFTELVSIDQQTAEVTVLGKIADGALITQVGWNASNGTLVGTLTRGGQNDEYTIVSIDPNELTVTEEFDTPYSVMLGLAPDPEEANRFVSWINTATGHYYGEINLETESIELISRAETVRSTGPFQYVTFDVANQLQFIPEPTSLSLAFYACTAITCLRRSRKSRR